MNLHLSFPVRSISRGIRDHDEASGCLPEVLERTWQPLRMSKLSSTSRSGREIRCFDVLRSTWVFQTIFNHFWAPFILFYNTVWANQTFVLLFFEGWTAGAIFFSKESWCEPCPVFVDGSGGKESLSISVYVFLPRFWAIILVQKNYLTSKRAN